MLLGLLVLVASALLPSTRTQAYDDTVVCPANTRDDDQKPVVISECESICGYVGFCVYYPYNYRDFCNGVLENRCLLAPECAFECFQDDTTAITLYKEWDDIMSYHSVTSTAALVNATLVHDFSADLDVSRINATNFYGQADPQDQLTGEAQLYTTTPEPVDFELPDSVFIGHPTRTSIALQYVKCPPLPTQKQEFPKLNVIWLQGCGYSALAWEKMATPSLTMMYLTHNELTDLPALPKAVMVLDLAHNSFTSIPPSIAEAPVLATLGLRNNPLGDQPSGSFPTALTVLLLRNCSMAKIPVDIAKMERLLVLDLSFNQIGDSFDESVIPATVWNLLLAWSGLTKVPTAFPSNTKLKRLDLSGNSVNPDDLADLPKGINFLILRQIKLQRIPAAIATRFTNLSTLDISMNPIEAIREGDSPKTLKELSMSDTPLTLIKKGVLPSSINKLSVTYGKLTQVPEDTAIDHTSHVNLTHNQITSVPSLTVTELDLSHNLIESTDEDLRDTVLLDLSFNRLTQFKLGIEIDTIRALYLRGNNLTSVPESLFRQRSLQILDLRGNPIRNYMPSTQEWPFLQRVPVVRMDFEQLRTNCSRKVRFKEHLICDPLASEEDLAENPSGSSSSAVIGGGHSTHGSSSSSSTRTIAIAVVVGTIAIALLVVAGIYYHRRRVKHLTNTGSVLGTNGTVASGDENMLWHDRELSLHRLDAALVRVDQLLASGMYGEVFLGAYQQQRIVLKRLKNRHGTHDETMQFVREIKMMASFKFPKIVRFVGVVWTKASDIALVTEYMAGGDLRSFLSLTKAKAKDGWTLDKFRIALDIAEALVYLHSLDPPMIHRDLKSYNVLLDGEMNAVLSDFGTTRPVDYMRTMTAEVGTALWMAPEVLAGRRYDQSADIYSLGVVFSELDTHELPFKRQDSPTESNGLHVLSGVMSGTLRIRFLLTCPASIVDLGVRCTELDPRDRPTTLEVATWDNLVDFESVLQEPTSALENASLVKQLAPDVDSLDMDEIYLSGQVRPVFDQQTNILYAYVPAPHPLDFAVPESFFTGHPTRLTLALQDVKCLSFLSSTPKFPELSSLCLRGCGYKSVSWENLQMPKLTRISLANNHLTELPGLPFDLYALDLLNNAFKAIPEAVRKLERIITLEMSNNPLKNLDKATFPYSLMDLYLNNCSLTRMPPGIAKIPKLWVLDLSYNPLGKSFDSSAISSSVTTLNLAWCDLPKVPTDFPDDTVLTSLDLSGNTVNPKGLAALPTTIEILSLQSTQLTEIPAGLGDRFTSLSVLDLSMNPIQFINRGDLPQTLTQLIMSHAPMPRLINEILSSSIDSVYVETRLIRRERRVTCASTITPQSITHGNLTEVPFDITRYQLSFVNLTHNQITSVPLLTVKQLDLSHNLIESVYEDLHETEILDLSYNQLTQFKLGSQVKSVKVLYFRGNKLTSVPDSLMRQRGLRYLDLRDNPIRNYMPTSQEWPFLQGIPAVRMDFEQLRTNCLRKSDSALSLVLSACVAMPSTRCITSVLLLVAVESFLHEAQAQSYNESITCPANTRDEDQQPVVISDCSSICGYEGLCVYYPYKYRDQCTGVYDNRCLEAEECTFECFPEYTSMITLYKTWDDLMTYSSLTIGSALVNASLVTQFRADVENLGHEVLYVAGQVRRPEGELEEREPSFPIDFTLPDSFFMGRPERKSLALTDLNCPPLPSTKQDFPKLATLWLEGCGYTDFAWSNMNAPSLVMMFLRQNQIAELPEMPKALMVLDISSNKFTSVPASLKKCPMFATLKMSNNPLGDQPADSFPTTLTVIALRNASLTKMPSDIAKMTRLLSLDLSYNLIGDSFDASKLSSKLWQLFLVSTGLTKVPDNFPEDTDIRHLDISGNPIHPDDITNLPVGITDLALRDIKLTKIPSAIATHFTNLSTLDISTNPIESIAPGDLPREITEFIMSDSPISKLDKGILSYRTDKVSITYCKLSEIPVDIINLHPSIVNLTHNEITSVPALIATNIDLSHNQIEKFDENLRDTVVLDLSYNRLTHFKLGPQIDTVRALYLRGNNLTSVPESLFRQRSLRIIDLRDNPITNYLPSTQDWPFLQRVPVVRMDVRQLKTNCIKKVRFKEHYICDPLNPVEDPTLASDGSGSALNDSTPSTVNVTNSKSLTSTVLTIAVAVIGTALVLIIAAGVICYRRRTHYSMAMAKILGTNETITSGADESSLWQDEDLVRHRLDASLVHVERLLGTGMYGEVFLATYQQQHVVIKRLKNRVSARQEIQQFVSEIKLMASFRFPKIVRFIGVVWTKESDVAVVTEYMANGDLCAYLDKTKRRARDGWTIEKLRIALDIAEALVYLHSLDPPMVHRDLKSCNVLLDGEMNAVLSDFGTTREVNDTSTMTAEVGTALWMAPEVLSGRRYDQSADVYSLGVILSELDTHELPFRDDGRPTMDGLHVMGGVMSGSLRIRFYPTCPEGIVSLGARCTQMDPKDRPSTLEVAYELRSMLRHEVQFASSLSQSRTSSSRRGNLYR
ncbi:hypothetical protein Poli38472_010876 [Pythium oligandrum]|uniref:Protein kinase domain-containing protein n=1 Tax=Pythium oligandrum TaxID=41045 RepID=A0A8K1FKK3_PYTOL|nr:hypothetical protein Poli38472_010876 [Pythium oligandrum]|eukprot:TMW61813.1 hypothetical protein Poli38472_010876 [Pythium oligandrum]